MSEDTVIVASSEPGSRTYVNGVLLAPGESVKVPADQVVTIHTFGPGAGGGFVPNPEVKS